MAKSRAYIRKLAKEILESNKVSTAPVDVESIAIEQGASIQRIDLEDNLAGFSFPDGNHKTIGVNLRNAPLRQRFTVAHELGHLLLHTANGLHYDRSFTYNNNIQFRNEVSSQGSDANEIEANFFAAELLMPEHLLLKDLESFGYIQLDHDSIEIEKLANKYETSKQAMTIRLSSIGQLKF